MVEVLVWLLVSVSSPNNSAGQGNLTVVGHFKDLGQCQHVLKAIPSHSVSVRCVQANILITK